MAKKPIDEVGILKPIFVRAVPETTRHQFRIACLQAEFSMNTVLIAVMKYLDSPEKVKEFMS